MKQYDTLILSGGAVKGFALLGALQYAMDNGIMKNIHKMIGTSIGAIIAYLICIGYAPVEIMVILCQTNFLGKLTNFDIYNVVHGTGGISFSIVNEMLEKLTVNKIGKFITLKQLQQEYGKTLICCTYNYTKDCEEFITPMNNPDIPCLTALRMSANLPLLFEPFRYNSSIYLDGGLVSNFPIHFIDKENDIALGFVLVNGENKDENMNHIPSPFELLWKMLSIPMNKLQKLRTDEFRHLCDLVEIELDTFSPLQFDISKSEKFDIFSIGYETSKRLFEKKSSPSEDNHFPIM